MMIPAGADRNWVSARLLCRRSRWCRRAFARPCPAL